MTKDALTSLPLRTPSDWIWLILFKIFFFFKERQITETWVARTDPDVGKMEKRIIIVIIMSVSVVYN